MMFYKLGTHKAQALTLLVVASLALAGQLVPHSAPQPYHESVPQAAQPGQDDVNLAARASAAFDQLPMRFDPNLGQFARSIQYMARSAGFTLALAADQAALTLFPPLPNDEPSSAQLQHMPPPVMVSMQFRGADPAVHLIGLGNMGSKSHYFRGQDPAGWRTNVPNYQRVRYQGLYPGINLDFYGSGDKWEYDFTVFPGSYPGSIQLSFAGAEGLDVDPQGDLLVHTALGDIRHSRPAIYQELDGVRRGVAGGFALRGQDEITFVVGAYDASRPLVIDPGASLVASSFLGGNGQDVHYPMGDFPSGFDAGRGVAVGSDGSVYMVGYTQSDDFPTTVGAFDRKCGPNGTVTVGPGTPTPTAYPAVLGGKCENNDPWDPLLAKDHGITSTVRLGFYVDMYVAKMSSDLSSLTYSTFLGGQRLEQPRRIKVDGSGNAYIVGSSYSADFPTTLGAYHRTCGTNGNCDFDSTADNAYKLDVVVVELNSSGNGLEYSTYLGGADAEDGYDLALDTGDSTIVITGKTHSRYDFPTTSDAFDRSCGCKSIDDSGGTSDAFVAKIDPAGQGESDLVYSTFLGANGSGDTDITDAARGVAVDSSHNVYITGYTDSTSTTGLPMCPDGSNAECASSSDAPYQAVPGGGRDAFVAKIVLDPESEQYGKLDYTTYLGGEGDENFPTTLWPHDPLGTAYPTEGRCALAIDSLGNVYVTGSTRSTDFPVTDNAYDETCGTDGGCDSEVMVAHSDAFLVRLNPAGNPATDLEYATYLGGSDDDLGWGIAVDSLGLAFVTGTTFSADFPASNADFGQTCTSCDPQHDNDTSDAFILELRPNGDTTADLIFSAFLGGSARDEGHGVVVSAGGGTESVYITGQTDSSGTAEPGTTAIPFPTRGNPYQPDFGGGGTDDFISKVLVPPTPTP